MNSTLELAKTWQESIDEILAKTVIDGDVSRLSPRERVLYYNAGSQSLGLNPLSKPFELIKLNGKLTLYARKDCTDQLRKLHKISIDPPQTQVVNDAFVVTVTARTKDGRTDTEIGAVSIKGLTGDSLCNSMMKAVTKAKRRVTLSICGLGMLDETSVDSVPGVIYSSHELNSNPTPEVWRNWEHIGDALTRGNPVQNGQGVLPTHSTTHRYPQYDALPVLYRNHCRTWAAAILPDKSTAELRKVFDSVPAVNGKKAPAFAQKVLEMATTF